MALPPPTSGPALTSNGDMEVAVYDYSLADPDYPRFKVLADPEFTRPFDTVDHLEHIVRSLGLTCGKDYVVWGDMISFYKQEHLTMFLLKYKPVDNS